MIYFKKYNKNFDKYIKDKNKKYIYKKIEDSVVKNVISSKISKNIRNY